MAYIDELKRRIEAAAKAHLIEKLVVSNDRMFNYESFVDAVDAVEQVHLLSAGASDHMRRVVYDMYMVNNTFDPR